MRRHRVRVLRGALLLGFAALIGKLFLTGQMVLYMSPALDVLTALTGLALALMGLIELRESRGSPASARARHFPGEDADHRTHGPEAILTYLLLLLPLAVGLVVTPRVLGSGALGGEPVSSLLLTFAPGTPRAPAAMPPAPRRPIDDTAELLAYLQEVGEAGVGQRVRAEGSVLRSDSLGRGEFALLRYSIVHCVADARPVVLLVVAPLAPALPGDQWVEVEGVLRSRESAGGRLVTIAADRVTPVKEPPNPYLRGGF
jgi:putative membrane protein